MKVNEYNNTPHSAYDNLFTPAEVERDVDVEGSFIRHEKRILRQVELRQRVLGLRGYQPGNVVLLHLDFRRTREHFANLNDYWNGIGIFLKYVGRNVMVWCLMTTTFRFTAIVISSSYTRIVCPHFLLIPPNYATHFNITVDDEEFYRIRNTIRADCHIEIPRTVAGAFLVNPQRHPVDPHALPRDALQHRDNTRDEIERRRQDELQTFGTQPRTPAPPFTESQEADNYAQMEQALHQIPIAIDDDDDDIPPPAPTPFTPLPVPKPKPKPRVRRIEVKPVAKRPAIPPNRVHGHMILRPLGRRQDSDSDSDVIVVPPDAIRRLRNGKR
jgi:hypothetical protein